MAPPIKAGDQTIVARNLDTGADERIPLSEYEDGVKSGQYAPGATVTVGQGGHEERESGDVAAHNVSAGTREVSEAGQIEAESKETQRKAFDTGDDKALTFGEGVVDALSLGLIHQHGDEAELRRDVNSGSALLGQLAGTAGGMFVTGPVKFVAGAGEAVGKEAAKNLLKSPILSRGITEASIGASLAGAGSIGHQLSDAIIDDKPFSAEAVMHEAGLGAVLGFGGGLAGGYLSSRLGAARAAVKGQGGLFDPASLKSLTVTDHVRDAVAAVDSSIEKHAANLGVMRTLADEGEIPVIGDLMEKRAGKLADARDARRRIGDAAEGLASDDPKTYARLHDALDDYLEHHADLDELMRPRGWENLKPVTPEPYRAQKVPGFGTPADVDAVQMANGHVNEMSAGLDEAMGSKVGDHPFDAATPNEIAANDRHLAYERNFGRKFERGPEPQATFDTSDASTGPISGEGGIGKTAEEQGLSDLGDHAGPDEATNANIRRKSPIVPAKKPDPFMELGSTPEGAGGYKEFRREGVPLSGPPQDPGYAAQFAKERLGPGRDVSWSVPAENPRFGPHTEASMASRPLAPQAEEGNLLHGAQGESGGQQVSVLPDGYMAKTSSLQENAANFAEFKNRLAEDTQARIARRAAAAEQRASLREMNGDLAPELQADSGLAGREGNHEDLKKLLGVADEAHPGETYGPAEAQSTPGATRNAEKPNARKWINDWYDQVKVSGPTASPGDIAANRITQAVNDIYAATDGRVDAVAALDLAPKYGIKPARSSLVSRMDQVWLLRKAADQVSREGVKAAEKSTGSVAKKALGLVFGAKVGGKLGALVGMVAGDYAGAVGKIASATAKLRLSVTEASAALLSPRTTGAAAAAVVSANRPVAYGDGPVLHDPVQRILQLQRLAASPDSIRDRVAKSAGDHTLVAPAFTQHLQEAAVGTVTSLSLKAPHIYFDRFNQPYSPPQQALRSFLEAENVAHNLPAALDAITAGNATRAQIEAVRDFYPTVASTLVREALNDPAALAKAPPARKRQIDILLGGGVATHSDPGFASRQAAAWAIQQPGAGQSPSKAQSLKMHSETAPTPASSTSPNQQ